MLPVKSRLVATFKTLPGIFLVIFLLFLCTSAFLIRNGASNQFLASSLGSHRNGNTLSTQGSFLVNTGSLPLEINIVAAPLSILSTDQPVYIYFYKQYPALGNDLRGWQGIADHLPVELRLRGYTGTITIVNATGLHDVLTRSSGGITIIPSGVLPLTVENDTTSLIAPWVRTGGTLVWMGGAFGYYSGMNKTLPGPLENGLPLGEQSQKLIFGQTLVDQAANDTVRIATMKTQFSSAMNLTYSDVWVAPTLQTLHTLGGVAVGHVQNVTDTSRASISLIPVGFGRIIIFGGPVGSLLTADGEDVISHDIAQIMFLGNLADSAQVEYTSFIFPSRSSESINFQAAFNITSLNVKGLVVAAFSDYSFSRLYWKTQLATG